MNLDRRTLRPHNSHVTTHRQGQPGEERPLPWQRAPSTGEGLPELHGIEDGLDVVDDAREVLQNGPLENTNKHTHTQSWGSVQRKLAVLSRWREQEQPLAQEL